MGCTEELSGKDGISRHMASSAGKHDCLLRDKVITLEKEKLQMQSDIDSLSKQLEDCVMQLASQFDERLEEFKTNMEN